MKHSSKSMIELLFLSFPGQVVSSGAFLVGSNVRLCRSFAAMEIEGPSVVPPIRNFHHAIPANKSFGGILVANALAI